MVFVVQTTKSIIERKRWKIKEKGEHSILPCILIVVKILCQSSTIHSSLMVGIPL